jgi:hypothetical protein
MDPKIKLDKYYRKRYNWTLVEVEALEEKQGHVCAGCGNPPPLDGRRLSVDHDHAYANQRVEITRDPEGGWFTCIDDVKFFAAKRGDVLRQAKAKLLHDSVRGLLCWKCNFGVLKFGGDPVRLRKLATYIESWEAQK